eukprot:3615694-Alexandrium_andersonii.AAC.1
MEEKARKGHRLVNQVDQGFLQHAAVSGVLQGQPNFPSDPKGAWQLVARARSRWVNEGLSLIQISEPTRLALI